MAPRREPTPNEVADLYDTFGPILSLVWDDNFHCGYWSGPEDGSSIQEATDRLTDLLIDRIDVGPSDTVLDVGCGIGKPAFRLAHATGAAVVGISINKRQVEQAADNANAAGLSGRVRFEHADAMAMPFADESFDAIWALESVIHMDRPRALAEMARTVKPGGRIVLTDVVEKTSLEEGRGVTRPNLDTLRQTSLPTLDEQRQLVRDANLVLDELRDISAHTKITKARIAEAVRTNKDLIEARFGAQGSAITETLLDPRVQNSEFGMVILVAHRPE